MINSRRLIRSIEQLKAVIQNRNEPSQLEIDNATIARSSYKIARLSMLLSLLSIGLIVWQIWMSPEKQQVDDLLKKANSVLAKDSVLLSIEADLFNLNAELANQTKADLLHKKFNSYNDLVRSAIELETYIATYREQRNGKVIVNVTSAMDRLKRINSIYEILKKMDRVEELIPNKKLGVLYAECMNHIIQCKMLYT